MRILMLTAAILVGVASATSPRMSFAADTATPDSGASTPAPPPADGQDGPAGSQGGGQGAGEGGGNCHRRPETPTS